MTPCATTIARCCSTRALSAGHAALIEAIYRSVYVMVTLKREDLLDAERDEELDDLVAAARRTMTETMEEGSP